MADKRINDLPVASELNDDSLLVVQQDATAKSIKGSLVKSFAVAAAKEQADKAAASATEAAGYVDTVAASARDAAQSAVDAAASEIAAGAAQAAAESAKTAAETAKTQAVSAKDEANTANTNAQSAKTAAEKAKTDAQSAQTAAESAKTAAQNAQTAAETAKTNAQGSATSASSSATQANTSATNAADSAETAKQYSGKPPKPQGGYWYIWNATTQQYENSNVKCTLSIDKTYSSIAEMNADAANVEVNTMAIIVSTLGDEDNNKLFIREDNTTTPWHFLGDLSGVQGVGVQSIELTSGNHAPGTTDTYTITYTDGSTSTYQVYNGADGTGTGDMLAADYDKNKVVKNSGGIVRYVDNQISNSLSDDFVQFRFDISRSPEQVRVGCYGNGYFVFFSENVSQVYYTSDFVYFFASELNDIYSRVSAVYADNTYVVLAENGYINYSKNLQKWFSVGLSKADEATYYSIVYGNGHFVALSNVSIDISSDLETWLSVDLPDEHIWATIAYGNGIFVIADEQDSATTNVYYSTDFTEWKEATTLPFGEVRSITYGNGFFVALSNQGHVAYCSYENITNWKSNDEIPQSDYAPIIYGNNTFLAASHNDDVLLTSTNLLEWNVNSLLTLPKNYFFGSGMFVFLGQDEVFYPSFDGINWKIYNIFPFYRSSGQTIQERADVEVAFTGIPKQEKLAFDINPVNGSNNILTSGSVYIALSGKMDTVYYDREGVVKNAGGIPDYVTANKLKYIFDGDATGSVRTAHASTEIGFAAFAEGSGTTASGEASHAEGINTYATGSYSHAEGSQTNATYVCAHAEGYGTLADGAYSHAEGFLTQANTDFTHAEGAQTKADGTGSHAEGINTKASSDYQHAQGKYNIEDSENVYAHIVGNGKVVPGGNILSNAHTLDWSGNAWFAGDVYVGSTSGTNKDEGSKKLATQPVATLVTLSASGWDSTTKTQTVTVSGVLADESAQLILSMPAMASRAAYNDAGVQCSAQAADSLTFVCDTVPTADLSVYVTVQEVQTA